MCETIRDKDKMLHFLEKHFVLRPEEYCYQFPAPVEYMQEEFRHWMEVRIDE